MIKRPSFSAKRSQYDAGKRESPRLPYCCSVSHSAQKGNVSAMACVRPSFCDRISHQFSFFIIFLPHSDVIMTLVKVESHPPLRAAFASFLPLHHTRRQVSSFFLPLPHLFPFHNEKRRFPPHHGTGAFRMHTLTAHYTDVKRKKGAGNEISRQSLNTKTFISAKHSLRLASIPNPLTFSVSPPDRGVFSLPRCSPSRAADKTAAASGRPRVCQAAYPSSARFWKNR